ncbi:MAG: 3-phosphoshikimate 1-carboxyvinyltransferase, partial [Muribaculaceae bacterium]|nr:3-phosphoshikimate 1-carboxyvinyltransferase [Muribaculaceae bacterium]
MNYRIFPPEGYLEGRFAVPLSKSMSNRALIINALTAGAEPIERLAECDDTEAMKRGLAAESGATV